MICAVFSGFWAVKITGHAGLADYGKDIVCASVSSAVQLCANGITEILRENAQVNVCENEVSIKLPKDASTAAVAFIQALRLHLTILKEQFPENIEITEEEIND